MRASACTVSKGRCNVSLPAFRCRTRGDGWTAWEAEVRRLSDTTLCSFRTEWMTQPPSPLAVNENAQNIRTRTHTVPPRRRRRRCPGPLAELTAHHDATLAGCLVVPTGYRSPTARRTRRFHAWSARNAAALRCGGDPGGGREMKPSTPDGNSSTVHPMSGSQPSDRTCTADISIQDNWKRAPLPLPGPTAPCELSQASGSF